MTPRAQPRWLLRLSAQLQKDRDSIGAVGNSDPLADPSKEGGGLRGRRVVTVDSEMPAPAPVNYGSTAADALAEGRRIMAEVKQTRERAEKRMAWAASEKRLGKEARALHRLEEINRRHGF